MPDAPDPRGLSPRDLDLARRLDARQAPDAADPLHAVLDSLQPLAPDVAPEASARMWEAIAAQTGLAPEAGVSRPTRAPDRAPARGVPTRVPRWVGAVAAALLVLSVGAWVALQWAERNAPTVVASASGEIETWTGPDGSTVALRPQSQLVRQGGERAYALTGEAFFDVESDPSRPFTIETAAGDVRVLGTRFNVSTWGGETHVYVEEGRVEISSRSNALVLNAGEGGVLLGASAERLRSPEADAFLDWQRGEAVFSRESVQRVASEIEHHFAVVVRLPPGVGRETVSGVIALDSAPQALEQLGRILGGTFQREGGAYRFARP